MFREFNKMQSRGFTLIELLVVVAIIGIIATVVVFSIYGARIKAQYSRAKLEMREMETALWFYSDDHGDALPADVDRSLPPGLELYLHNPAAAGMWPNAPFAGSVYDWDAWDVDGDGDVETYQISIRFCPIGGPLSACNFPNEPWAAGFDINSAMYYCLEGMCRSHASEPVDYPGHCVNC